MKVLVDKNSKAVIAISEKAVVVESGIDVGGCIYCMKDKIDVYEVETIPPEVKPQQYCYTPENGFYQNANYINRQQQSVADLKRQLEGMQMKLNAITGSN